MSKTKITAKEVADKILSKDLLVEEKLSWWGFASRIGIEFLLKVHGVPGVVDVFVRIATESNGYNEQVKTEYKKYIEENYVGDTNFKD